MSQNTLADTIGYEPSFLSKVLLGKTKSAPMWVQIQRFLANPKGYRPVPRRSPKLPRPAQIKRALALLRKVAG